MGACCSTLSIFRSSYKYLTCSAEYLETHTTKQILEHIDILRYKDCFDPINKGWNKVWYRISYGSITFSL